MEVSRREKEAEGRRKIWFEEKEERSQIGFSNTLEEYQGVERAPFSCEARRMEREGEEEHVIEISEETMEGREEDTAVEEEVAPPPMVRSLKSLLKNFKSSTVRVSANVCVYVSPCVRLFADFM